jgi:16S rRNA processing protein RimM
MTTPVDGGRPDVHVLVVGRIGRPHGVGGDVFVEVRTDDPERRLDVGAVLATDRRDLASLTVTAARWHSGRLLLHFEGFDDRTAVERLRGVSLLVEVDPDEQPEDPEEFYDHQLVGLAVVGVGGESVGEVTQVVHGAQDVLVVRLPSGVEALVPFVAAIVPVVDLEAGRVVVDLPLGLLELGGGPL